MPCPEYIFELTNGSMTAHQRRMHRTEMAIYWNRMPVSQTEHLRQVYNVSSPKIMTQCPCHLPGCPVSSMTWNRIRNHFNQHHWGYSIIILEKQSSPFPKCGRCGIHVPLWRLNSHHYESEKCRIGEVRRI